MTRLVPLHNARRILKLGGVLAYPTEAVYGLGCDALNEASVYRILALKNRPVSKGLIILIHDWDQLTPLIAKIPPECMEKVRATWPGPVTWVFPKSSSVPSFLSGDHNTIAIRMSHHPVANALAVDGPIVSTSANITTQLPARDYSTVIAQFSYEIDGIVEGDVGIESQPSQIFDVLTGIQLR